MKRKSLQLDIFHNPSSTLTHSDPGVHAESLHQHIVEDDGQQSHQDVGETHVEHDGRPWNAQAETTERGGGDGGRAGSSAANQAATFKLLVQVVHVGDEAVVGKQEAHASQ